MPSHSQGPEEKRLIIGIAGRIGAGKTSAAKYLSTKHGFQYLRYSQVLAEWKAANPESKAQLQSVGWEVMAGGMQPELNRRLIAQVRAGDVVVDGLRHVTDYNALRESFGISFHLVYIESSAETRFGRLKAAGKYSSRTGFEAADAHPVEQQIESLRASSALVIKNEGSLQDLFRIIDRAVAEFRKEDKA